jgi:hypothetical protein
MNLGRKLFTVGNTTRYAVDYSQWLGEGVTLVSGTAVQLAPAVADIVISAVSVAPSGRLYYTLSGGSLNETFTIAVQITDSRSEIKNDSCSFLVVAP